MDTSATNRYSVYIHVNKTNDMKYIGITSQIPPSQRWGKDGVGYHNGQKKFYDAIKEYGWDMFEHIILCTQLTKEDALNIEEELIAKYDTVNKGYNSSYTGKHNYISEDGKNKLRQKRYGQDNPNYNPNRKHKYRYEKYQTSEGIKIKKILNYTFAQEETSNDGRKSIEFRELQRRLKTGEGNPNYSKRTWNFGKKMSEESKQKMRDSFTEEKRNKFRKQKLGSNNPQAKKVFCITTNTVYDTIVDAARQNNVSERSVSECCNKKINAVKGLEFVFLKEVMQSDSA